MALLEVTPTTPTFGLARTFPSIIFLIKSKLGKNFKMLLQTMSIKKANLENKNTLKNNPLNNLVFSLKICKGVRLPKSIISLQKRAESLIRNLPLLPLYVLW